MKQTLTPRVMKDVPLRMVDGSTKILSANMLDIEGQAVFHFSIYEDVFGKKKKEQQQSKQRLSVVRITNEVKKRTVYRVYKSLSIEGLTKDVVMLSPATLQELCIDQMKWWCQKDVIYAFS